MAQEQVRIQQLFKFGNQLRHTGLGHAHGIGGAAHAAQVIQHDQGLHMSQTSARHQPAQEGQGIGGHLR